MRIADDVEVLLLPFVILSKEGRRDLDANITSLFENILVNSGSTWQFLPQQFAVLC